MLISNIHLQRIYWAISSPSLLAYTNCTTYFKDDEHAQRVMQILHGSDTRPEAVNAYFNGLGHMPMGKYFEQLLFFILQRDERYEIILQNHQLYEEKTTIGEIDLIVKDTLSGEIEHWEIALKFYLQSKASAQHRYMIGPNAVDDLGRKMEKLTDHQLLLSHHSSIKNLLGAKETTPKLFLKGQFFYHLGKATVLPLNADPYHEHGWWCHISELDAMITDDLHWCILQKPDWIGLHHTENTADQFSSDAIKELLTAHFNQVDGSILLVGMRRTHIGWTEQTRGFVVAENWPKITHTD